MPRKLKTFRTSLGFYDLAIAAPSMKAALEAWGAGSNLFHQGIAEETDDPEVVAATLAKPGVVLKRPAGSNGRFAEHSGLPSETAADKIGRRPKAGQAKPKPEPEDRASAASRDKEAARKAAASFEREQARREAQIRQEEAALARKREQRQKLIAKAQAAFENAEREHEARAAALEAERAAVEERAQAEEARWFRQKEKLTAALRRAREQLR
ncbi:cell envelope biogenesis protein TolA [Bradyrhizobium sp. AS23.2]|uniref:cell envelope biogenesis protein TolA n=1 Tax=Bradyrhizobium sp. AS23.2 TaxID=1680155 RepID=UPI000938B448|nr:cell envelope biogenesis protein TolA [Bradyrhizobium sp. AS23.2]OKO86388.1 TolA protein [Bradyrhizobium sp. AS23.2]